MGGPKCSCEEFDRLEGASVNAYAAAFLEDLGRADASKRNLYRCRVCGTHWEKRAPDADAKMARASLVKVSER